MVNLWIWKIRYEWCKSQTSLASYSKFQFSSKRNVKVDVHIHFFLFKISDFKVTQNLWSWYTCFYFHLYHENDQLTKSLICNLNFVKPPKKNKKTKRISLCSLHMKSLLDPMDRFLFFPLSLSLSLLISRVEPHEWTKYNTFLHDKEHENSWEFVKYIMIIDALYKRNTIKEKKK